MCIQVVHCNMTQWAKPKNCCVIFNSARSGMGLPKLVKQDLHGLDLTLHYWNGLRMHSVSSSALAVPVMIETGTKRTKKTLVHKFISALQFR